MPLRRPPRRGPRLGSNAIERDFVLVSIEGRPPRQQALLLPRGSATVTTNEQVHALVNKSTVEDFRPQIARHKSDIERYQNILLPTVIYGDEVPPVREPNMDVLTGIPTSIGHYTGKVKVVKGIQDFSKVSQGDVLVIPYSDVGWTPLFARAGAVVAESGGLLSHSSIIAREYNIPVVVSIEGATMLMDETLVTVDGHKGEIYIHAK